MGRTERRSANARRRTYLANPTRALTSADWRQIRFTQRMIHPTFSNRKELSVFDMYFAVRYQLMDVSDIPAIRVFQGDDGKLWSVDNRRLWVMKKAQRGFNCEELYTREQDPNRFNEVDIKIRSLQGTPGEHVWFRSRELPDQIHLCCIQASRCGKLDTHIANDHLNIDLELIILLSRCPIHHQDRISCTCLISCAGGTLKDMVQHRCRTLKQIMTNAGIEPSNGHVKLFEKFANTISLPDLDITNFLTFDF